MPAVITIRTQKQRQQEEEEEDKKKKEEQKQPRKKNPQPLNYDEAILLLEFFSLNDPISFKSHCDTHVDVLGEQASDKRKRMQDQYSNWKKKGLPSKYNNASKYPKELVRSASFKLSLIAKQKVENHRENNNSNRKGNETPRNEKSDKNSNSKEENKKLPTSPDDVRVNFCFPLNINDPYINVQGAFPLRIPSCPDISKIGKEIVGYYDKLCFHLPCWEMTDSVRNQSYKAWLHHEGIGLFVMMPPTGGCFIKQVDKFHNECCDMTRHRLENFLAGTNNDVRIIVFYEFPDNIICSNKHFNSTTALQRPADKEALLPKTKLTHNWLFEPSVNEEEPDGVYEITGGILWEMEIVSEDNFHIEEKIDDRNVLQEMIATMNRV